MNTLLFFAEMLFFLCAALCAYRFFGKTGLYAYSVFAVLLCNIQVCLSIDVFGMSATGGNAIYASTFLVTDILSERFGKKAANKAVLLGFFAMILWICGTQLTLLFAPNESDFVHGALEQVFSLLPRVSAASLAAYLISQTADVWLYHFIWEKTGKNKKYLWVRNNLSTLCSQLLDSCVFVFTAFFGVYETKVFVSILITTYVFKVVCALCDTPFMYLARRICPEN